MNYQLTLNEAPDGGIAAGLQEQERHSRVHERGRDTPGEFPDESPAPLCMRVDR